jgi:4-alpha-glucanotransferase
LLAEAHGVATSYESTSGDVIPTAALGVRAALTALGVPARDDAEVRASLIEAAAEPWRRLVPLTAVARQGEALEVPLHVPVPEQPAAHVLLETGEERPVDGARRSGQARAVDGHDVERWIFPLPTDLPTGDHRLIVSAGEVRADTALIVVPPRCPLPERRIWGWMLQLYATRSTASWGIGDLADLGTLARWSGQVGAGFLLVNPLHAVAPGPPQQRSPYFPSSRHFLNPLYLRIEDVPEFGQLPPEGAERVAELAAACRLLNQADLIDRDAVEAAKREALELLYTVPLPPERAAQFEAYRAEQGRALVDFATFCALAERHGHSWQRWPAPLHRPDSPSVEAARQELSDRITFHCWVQWLADTQLAMAQQAARTAGMSIGIITDLAVGIDPGGADAWMLQDELASGVTIGAPPDDFNPLGQDWELPPLLPNRLPFSGYAPFRELVRANLRHAGGIRIDHILGLFRLWWAPDGADPSEGTYVHYPASDLLGVLTLEAERAGAIIVGEDLGTVPSGVRETLWDRGILGNRVVWFERTGPDLHRAQADEYAALALTSVTTHDLPTAAGFWSGGAERTRVELGLLPEGTSIEEEQQRAAQERAELQVLLRDEGLIGDTPTLDELVLAVQQFAARTPSWLVGIALGDAIADPRQPNMPGTLDQYPNWRLPLHDPLTGTPALLGRLLDDSRVQRLVEALHRARGGEDAPAQS